MRATAPLGITPKWACPVCRERFTVAELWTHLEGAHGVYRTALDEGQAVGWQAIRMALTNRLLDLIDDASSDPHEHIPSRVRHAARDLRSVMRMDAP